MRLHLNDSRGQCCQMKEKYTVLRNSLFNSHILIYFLFFIWHVFYSFLLPLRFLRHILNADVTLCLLPIYLLSFLLSLCRTWDRSGHQRCRLCISITVAAAGLLLLPSHQVLIPLPSPRSSFLSGSLSSDILFATLLPFLPSQTVCVIILEPYSLSSTASWYLEENKKENMGHWAKEQQQ